jgi:hypothetical protein
MKGYIINHNLLNPDLIEVFRDKDNTLIGSIEIKGNTYNARPAQGNIKPCTSLEIALGCLIASYTDKPVPNHAQLITEAVRQYKSALYFRANVTPGIIRELTKRMEGASDAEIQETINRLKIAVQNNYKKHSLI